MKSNTIKYLWLLLILIPVVAVLILLREEAFRFEHKLYLWLMCALAPALILFTLFHIWRDNSFSRFAKSWLIEELAPETSFNRHLVKFILLALAFEFIVIGLANPQIGTKQEKIKRQGIDVMIALDVSNSMLSEDVKPNRLARAKNFMGNLIDELKNDRIGIVVFAGKAYMQMPLTVDYSAAKMYLQTINPGLVPTQGTDIAAAVNLANESFVQADDKHKALIVISDGEDNEGGAKEAIESAAKAGVKVFTIGVGTGNGSPIPMAGDFKRDEGGNIVLSKMNEQMLRDLAAKGNGKYFTLGSGKDEIAAIFKELGRINTKQYEELTFTDFDDKYQWSLAIAAILLLAEWWLSERKSRFSFQF